MPPGARWGAVAPHITCATSYDMYHGAGASLHAKVVTASFLERTARVPRVCPRAGAGSAFSNVLSLSSVGTRGAWREAPDGDTSAADAVRANADDNDGRVLRHVLCTWCASERPRHMTMATMLRPPTT